MFEVKFINGKKGRGVVAKKAIKKGTVLDIAHCVLLSQKEYDIVEKTIIYDYLFDWETMVNGDRTAKTSAIAMSPCEFCNHSYKPNAEYSLSYKDLTITFTTIKNIKAGEEITVNYNGRIDDRSPLWFQVHE
nr:SET domain-containing protein-lysine N-methyltransferase [Candidatus Sigynarchaeota archaeon]